MSSSQGKLKSSIGKIFITLCASGDVDKLNNFIQKEPSVLYHRNPESGEDGIYYAIRSLKYNTTKYLLNKDFKISQNKVRKLMGGSGWRASVDSYRFLREFGLSIYSDLPSGETEKSYSEWVFSTYTDYCFSNHNLRKLLLIMEIENKLSHKSILDILNRYEKRINFNKRNANYISNIRELKLMALLYED